MRNVARTVPPGSDERGYALRSLVEQSWARGYISLCRSHDAQCVSPFMPADAGEGVFEARVVKLREAAVPDIDHD